MPFERNALVGAKGTHVYCVAVNDWSGVRATPFLRHGVVVGGGEYRVHVQWDGARDLDRHNRSDGERSWSPTPLEAWLLAQGQVEEIHARAEKTLSDASAALDAIAVALEECDA